jgi:hypothetical protein
LLELGGLGVIWVRWIRDGLIIGLLFSLVDGGGIRGGGGIIVDLLKEPGSIEVGGDVGVGVVGGTDGMGGPKVFESEQVGESFECIVEDTMELRGDVSGGGVEDEVNGSGMLGRLAEVTTNPSAVVPLGLRFTGLEGR